MSEDLISIAVGKPFTFKNKHFLGDGAYFENLGNGIWMQVIYLTRISEEEQKNIEESTPEFRYLRRGNCLLSLVGYGEGFVFEMEFDPTLYLKNNIEIGLELMMSSDLMTTILVEDTNNIVKAIRSSRIPAELFSMMRECYDGAFREQIFSKKYKNWVDELRNLHPLQIWEIAEKVE